MVEVWDEVIDRRKRMELVEEFLLMQLHMRHVFRTGLDVRLYTFIYRNLRYHMFWPQLGITLDEHSIDQIGAIADEHVSKPSDPRAERQWAVHNVHNEGIVSRIASRMSIMKSSSVFLRRNGREGLQFIRPKTLPRGMSSIKSSTHQPNVQVWLRKTYGWKWRSQWCVVCY